MEKKRDGRGRRNNKQSPFMQESKEVSYSIYVLYKDKFPPNGSKTPSNASLAAVFYHTSRWTIVLSYICLDCTLLFEFILSTQFFVCHIQVLRKISLSPPHHGISLDFTAYVWPPPCAKTPLLFPHPPYFQPHATPSLLELLEVSLYVAQPRFPGACLHGAVGRVNRL